MGDGWRRAVAAARATQKPKRGTCVECERSVRLRVDGRTHNHWIGAAGNYCPGSSRRPAYAPPPAAAKRGA